MSRPRLRCPPLAVAVTLVGFLFASPVARAAEESEEAFRIAYEAGTGLYKDARYAEALAKFEAAYALRPAREVIFAKARCLHHMERYPEAAAAYEEFLGTAPAEDAALKARVHLANVLLKVAHAALAAGDPAAARAAAARAIEAYRSKDPALDDEVSGNLLATLGDAHAALGEREEAISAYERALVGVTSDELRARLESGLAVLRATPATPATPSITEPTAAAAPGRGRWLLPVVTGIGTLAATAAGATLLILSQRDLVTDGAQKEYFASYEARRRELRSGWGLVIGAAVLGATTIVSVSVIATKDGGSGGTTATAVPAVGIGPGAVSFSWRF